MNIEIHGRHALLFDDDTAAAFVNSDDALVEWNSLLIDRYDVRHLLSTPPPSRRRRNPQTSHSSSADADLDYERYLDLPSPSEEEQEEEEATPEPTGGFNAVPFSYGNDEDPNDQKTAETEPEVPKFHPPFPVPESLVQNLPPTEKVHQIIARTALFVSKNGGQSEIVLRVKQGDNPTFGFLMPDHHLHPYFRYLVDNQDLLHSKDNGQPENEEKISNTGALSLLGSVYGTGEDDDGGTDHPSSSFKKCLSGNPVNADSTIPSAAVKTVLSSDKDEPVIKKTSLSNALKERRTSSVKKDEFLGSLSSVPDKSRASSLPPIPKAELLFVDPPSEMKRLVDKIVEFIMKNGRQFEAVLMEQDRGHGRFPFLIPSNIFHPYYLKVLQKAQESKLTGKSYNEKEDFRGHISNKKKSISRENENDITESDDIPLDSERKEKFKMVINKSKKEGSDVPDKSTQSPPRVQVDADQAAAILQAATRGIKPSNLGFLYGQPSNEDGSSESHLTHEQKLKAERLKRAKMFVAQLKSGAAPLKVGPSRGSSAEPQTDNCFVAKETEKNTLPSDVGTSDNKSKSEKEHLNEERRAMRKYRARSTKDKKDDHDDDDDDDERAMRKYRARSTKDKKDDHDDDDYDDDEREMSHRHHSKKHRSRNHSVEDERKERHADERDYKHTKRQHRSHRSSHKHDDDMDRITEEKDQKYSKKKKHRSSSSYEDDEQESEHERSRKKHRSHVDEQESEQHSRKKHRYEDEQESEHEYSRKKHRSHHSSDDEDDSDDKHSRRKQKHRSHKSSHGHKHRKSHSSRRKEKHNESSEEESRDQNKADKNVKGPNSEREELEEGEITDPSKGVSLVNGATREPSVDASSSLQDSRPLTQPSTTTEVSDDLRAKIRAMLMSTM